MDVGVLIFWGGLIVMLDLVVRTMAPNFRSSVAVLSILLVSLTLKFSMFCIWVVPCANKETAAKVCTTSGILFMSRVIALSCFFFEMVMLVFPWVTWHPMRLST